jgi:hypothetical protein
LSEDAQLNSFRSRTSGSTERRTVIWRSADMDVCLGQHFAKMEMRLIFSEFLKRIQDVSLAGKPEWTQRTSWAG